MKRAPFPAGECGEIAVKVIDDRGNELLVVKDLKEAEGWEDYMSRSAEALMKEAMALPDTERASLIDGLLATLDPGKDADADHLWAMEIERRGG